MEAACERALAIIAISYSSVSATFKSGLDARARLSNLSGSRSCATGDGALVRALEAARRTVVATDLHTTGHDFLTTPLPPGCCSLITNPPYEPLDKFLDRTLTLLAAPDNDLMAAVLLLRWDHLMASTHGAILQHAIDAMSIETEYGEVFRQPAERHDH